MLERTTALRETIAQLETLRHRAPPPARGDDPPPLVGRRVPRPGDGRAHRADEPLLRAARARSRASTPSRPRAIRIASPMHDVGKIAIPDRILLKPGRLTDRASAQVMEAHAEIGPPHPRRLRESSCSTSPREMALTHHERIDGTGYPAGARRRRRSRSRDGSAPSPTSSTRSPSDRVYRPALPAGRGPRDDGARAAARSSTPSCSTSSSARSTTCW